jgi:hypothetical protein
MVRSEDVCSAPSGSRKMVYLPRLSLSRHFKLERNDINITITTSQRKIAQRSPAGPLSNIQHEVLDPPEQPLRSPSYASVHLRDGFNYSYQDKLGGRKAQNCESRPNREERGKGRERDARRR